MTLTQEQIQNEYADQLPLLEEISAEISQGSGFDPVEFTAHHCFNDADGYAHSITAFYYQSKEAMDALEDGDYGQLDWEVDHYELD